MDDREAFRISCQIEPSDNIPSSCANSIIGTGKKLKYIKYNVHKLLNYEIKMCMTDYYSRTFFTVMNIKRMIQFQVIVAAKAYMDYPMMVCTHQTTL